ncbi:NAD-dependent protein deacylase [Tissierella creatinophila]|uniref:protein acetyllysine N-acetyltransferase n=1 Tax=Tissierella creatinophila DSM 6911 TaxID=1123403 RepID=A0A1U7M7B6_TISCR|nr:NAD-dependent protein deacylase [Tissierella creatinophila]OLS03181.1 NAD-dependent protein deacetylase [Tissierella creatinophila DSM 6911]
MNKYKDAKNLIDNAKDIVVLTGAGMSTESGVKDFRSQYGLIHTNKGGYTPSEILSRMFFYSRPEIFYNYLKEYLNMDGILPNEGHKILAELENNKRVTILTQNIDSLHQKAGSKNIIELHGNMENTYCTNCSKEKTIDEVFKDGPHCECGGLYKTEIVLYGENVPGIKEIFKRVEKADLLIVLGTSLMVQPVASVPVAFGYGKKPIIIINQEETFLTGVDDVIEFNEEIGETLKKIISEA